MAKKTGGEHAPRENLENDLEYKKPQEINKKNVNKKVDTNHLISYSYK